MLATFEVSRDRFPLRKFYLRQGESVRVGKTQWADVAIPGDARLADVHFALACDAGACRISDLTGRQRTLVNGRPVSVAFLQCGDEVSAGETRLKVRIEREDLAAAASEPESESRPGATADDGDPFIDAPLRELACRAELDERAAALVVDRSGPLAAVERLLEEYDRRVVEISEKGRARGGRRAPRCNLLDSAMRLLAFSLKKRRATAWLVAATRTTAGEKLSSADERCLAAAEAWAADPSESSRRAALVAAEASQPDRPATWAAFAAAWSAGPASSATWDLPEPEQPDAPDEDSDAVTEDPATEDLERERDCLLTAISVTGGITMAAAQADAPLAQALRHLVELAVGS